MIMSNQPNPIDNLLATFDRMLEICYYALSPTATPRQKQEARDMIRDWRSQSAPEPKQPKK